MKRFVLVALGVFLIVLGLLSTVSQAGSAGADTAGSSATTVTKSVTRHVLVTQDGKPTNIDEGSTYKVTLTVGQTADLKGRQEIAVSWTGAHPTGAVVADQNSIAAQYEEYPLVLLECRGIDSSAASPADQLTPETCWTQSWSERFQSTYGDDYPAYRLDEYASAAQRAPAVGAPASLAAQCKLDLIGASTQYWVPFDAANGTVYPGGPAGCAGEAPETDDAGGSPLPSNETFGVSSADGSGTANFDVFSGAENASLGCSATVRCALVAVPIVGISCDSTDTTGTVSSSEITACEQQGAYAPGQLVSPSGGSELPVTGSLWWSPSNWQNRITIPLNFAVAPDACNLVNSAHRNTVDVYGSELVVQATDQWEPQFCLHEPFSFVHVQTPEPEARNLIATKSAEAAFVSEPPSSGYGRPVVEAPVAVTGFTISYRIDAANGQPYTSLKLTARLLVKLLTESYPGDLFLAQAMAASSTPYAAMANNPLNITMDPEFQKLNPGVAANRSASADPAATLMALSSSSDVMFALTSYIEADPTARVWLDGHPDENGMVVNPAYKGMKLPVDQWPLLSTFQPSDYYSLDLNDCLYNDPLPYQPLIAAPLPSLESITRSMQFAQPNSTTVCSQPIAGSSAGEKLVTNAREPAGFRFILGITPLADNERYLLDAAELETTTGTFVAPTAASLSAAAKLLKPDVKTGTWPIPYAGFKTSPGTSAYPGTMVVYAAIPTSGLPTADASNYAALLEFAASHGQVQGVGVGELPEGFLSLTSTPALSRLAAYTQAAATYVAAQKGSLPSVTDPVPLSNTLPPAPGSGHGTGQPESNPPARANALSTSFGGAGTGLVSRPPTAASPTPAGRPSRAVAQISTVFPEGRTPGAELWTAGPALLILLGVGLAGAGFAPTVLAFGRRRSLW